MNIQDIIIAYLQTPQYMRTPSGRYRLTYPVTLSGLIYQSFNSIDYPPKDSIILDDCGYFGQCILTPQYKLTWGGWCKCYPRGFRGRYESIELVDKPPQDSLIFEGSRCITIWELTENSTMEDWKGLTIL